MKNGKYSINELLEPVNKCLALKSVQEFIYHIFYNPKKKTRTLPEISTAKSTVNFSTERIILLYLSIIDISNSTIIIKKTTCISQQLYWDGTVAGRVGVLKYCNTNMHIATQRYYELWACGPIAYYLQYALRWRFVHLCTYIYIIDIVNIRFTFTSHMPQHIDYYCCWLTHIALRFDTFLFGFDAGVKLCNGFCFSITFVVVIMVINLGRFCQNQA